ncbi:hypothetical protein N9L57_01710, partial [Alphaproteobacteria bacterium]|nr:hypothetical protein [Alphaproteobacteria bacterium]
AVRRDLAEASKSRDALSARVDEIEEVLSLALNSAAEKIEAILPDMTNGSQNAPPTQETSNPLG